MHPSAVGGVQRYVAHAQEDLAVAWLRHGAFDEAKMLGPELARRLLDQQNLPIEASFMTKALSVVMLAVSHRETLKFQSFFVPPTHAFRSDEKKRNEEDAKDRRCNHTAKHGRPYGMA